MRLLNGRIFFPGDNSLDYSGNKSVFRRARTGGDRAVFEFFKADEWQRSRKAALDSVS